MSSIYISIYLAQFQEEVKNNYSIDQLNKVDVEKILTELAGQLWWISPARIERMAVL